MQQVIEYRESLKLCHKNYGWAFLKESPVVHYPGLFFCWFHVRNLFFHDFSWFTETNGMVPGLFHKTVSSPYIGSMGTIVPMVTWCVWYFEHLTMLTFQCDFKFKTLFGQIWPPIPDMWRVFLHHDLISRKKRILHAHDIFYAQTKNPVKKIRFLVLLCIKFLWYVCFAAQTQFCCESD